MLLNVCENKCGDIDSFTLIYCAVYVLYHCSSVLSYCSRFVVPSLYKNDKMIDSSRRKLRVRALAAMIRKSIDSVRVEEDRKCSEVIYWMNIVWQD